MSKFEKTGGSSSLKDGWAGWTDTRDPAAAVPKARSTQSWGEESSGGYPFERLERTSCFSELWGPHSRPTAGEEGHTWFSE